MKNRFIKELSKWGLSALVLTFSLAAAQALPPKTQELVAQRAIETRDRLFSGNRAPSVVKAGLANTAADHFIEVEVDGEALERLSIVCVTFHELSGVKVIDSKTNAGIPHTIDFGFEEFVITFNEPVAVGTKVRTIIEGSTVRGLNSGLIVPYRVFASSRTLGEIPVGTAIVRTPDTE